MLLNYKTSNTDCIPTGTIPCSLHMVTMMAHDYTLQILIDLVPPTKLVAIYNKHHEQDASKVYR